jgi:hypothetical protein
MHPRTFPPVLKGWRGSRLLEGNLHQLAQYVGAGDDANWLLFRVDNVEPMEPVFAELLNDLREWRGGEDKKGGARISAQWKSKCFAELSTHPHSSCLAFTHPSGALPTCPNVSWVLQVTSLCPTSSPMTWGLLRATTS